MSEGNRCYCCCCAYLNPPWWVTMGYAAPVGFRGQAPRTFQGPTDDTQVPAQTDGAQAAAQAQTELALEKAMASYQAALSGIQQMIS
jgi:hypothetical protein